jgi:hypothetical protein
MTPVLMSDCAGLWRRALLIDEAEAQDTSSDVRWLQGITAFLDLRRPASRPDFTGVRSADDFTAAQRDWLSAQDGFAGRLAQRGDIFEWSHIADLRPVGPHPDAGRMCWEADTLVEVGVHAGYIEYWVRDDSPVSPSWALRCSADGGDAMLLQVGNHFGWAWRTHAGVEIALGAVDAADWVVTDSALPFREGCLLGPRLRVNELCVDDVDEDGKPIVRRWRVEESEGNVTL